MTSRRVVFVAIAIAVALSCVAPQPQPVMVSPPSNVGGAPSPAIAYGDYLCQIERYDPFRCVVRDEGGRLFLDKLGGSIRFRGWIRPDANGGFELQGDLYCAYIECTEPLRTYFQPTANGFVGQVSQRGNTPMTVTLWPARYDAYGGISYGGGGYGGYGYGGPGYGGSGYGGAYYGGGYRR
jgi:hypothetical protein